MPASKTQKLGPAALRLLHYVKDLGPQALKADVNRALGRHDAAAAEAAPAAVPATDATEAAPAAATTIPATATATTTPAPATTTPATAPAVVP